MPNQILMYVFDKFYINLNENSFESIHQVMHGDEHEFVQFNKQPSRKLVSMTKHQNVKALLDMDIT